MLLAMESRDVVDDLKGFIYSKARAMVVTEEDGMEDDDDMSEIYSNNDDVDDGDGVVVV
jgi:hypothetical protein